MTINYEAGLTDAYPSAREFVAYRVHHQGKAQKVIAADMDYSPSHLTRKCAQSPDDSMRLTLDDFEKFVQTTGDISPVLYLVEKYLVDKDRIAELEAELARLKAAK